MEDLRVPEAPGRSAGPASRPATPAPGRQKDSSDAKATPTTPRKPRTGRIKQLFGGGEKRADDRGEEPDTALMFKMFDVPLQLRGLPSQVLFARSLAHALFAVKHLTLDTGGAKYNALTFAAGWLSYQERPLLRRAEWPAFLSAFLFEACGEELANDLIANGFDRAALTAIWDQGDAHRGGGSASDGGKPSTLGEMIDRIWKHVYVPNLWYRRSLPEIAQLIYAHGYLAAPDVTPEGKRAATRGDVAYWRTLPPNAHTEDNELVAHRQAGDAYDVGEFYYLGEAIQTTYRIYLHAKPALIGAVAGIVNGAMANHAHRWCMKVVSPAEVTFRPDTIVVYTSDPERESVTALANTLAGAITRRSLADATPGLTHRVAPGVAMAWGPDGAVRNHSFGSYCAGILAEAFYDVVASIPDPTKRDLAAVARYQFGRYGLDPDDPAQGPAKLAEEVPPRPSHDGVQNETRDRVFDAMTDRASNRTPKTRPVGGVRVVPEEHLKLLPGAARNLKPPKPQGT